MVSEVSEELGLTELQETQIFYSKFTLQEWIIINRALNKYQELGFESAETIYNILIKLPSMSNS